MGARPGATYNYAAPPPEIVERVQQIEAICARYDVPLHRAAAQFALAHPAVTAVLLGAVIPFPRCRPIVMLCSHPSTRAVGRPEGRGAAARGCAGSVCVTR